MRVLDGTARALDRFLRRPKHRKLSRRIIRRQDALRAAVSPKAWKIYLELEALANERDQIVLVKMVRLVRRR